MWRRFARLSEKTSDAQFPEDGGDLGIDQKGNSQRRAGALIGFAPKT
jgi:hypothetical protein